MDVGVPVRTTGQNNASEGDVRGPTGASLRGRHSDGLMPPLRHNEFRGHGSQRSQRTNPARRLTAQLTKAAACVLLASGIPTAMSQDSCISLADSNACRAFNASSISTDSTLTGLFPFLSDVTDAESFDTEIENYINGDYAQTKYQQLLGCDDSTSDNTTAFYARYTTSVICNAIIQNSAEPCGLDSDATRPLCADSCAEYALSEQEIAASDVCGTADSDTLTQIRADFTNCALPADSLSGACIPAVENEPDNCGFNSNLGSLCLYCSSSSPNATDSCCVFSETEERCDDVSLPVIASSSLSPIVTTLTTGAESSPTSESSPTAAATHRGLTGGQIAGIVVGAVLGALALLALIIFGCVLLRKRRSRSPATSIFNQPSTMKQTPPASSYTDAGGEKNRAGMSVLGGGRVTRMTAIEHSNSPTPDEQSPILATGAAGGKSSSEEDSPTTRRHMPPPRTGARNGSLSSNAQLTPGATTATTGGGFDSSSPDWTSPESAGQSEQLSFFKDYYSSDEIHPTSIVAALWAYEPRAADEFHLERGDLVKVVGIWDDGWATGVRVRGKAEDWKPNMQRDSGMTDHEARTQQNGEAGGEVKAFPLVCVCLPQHWRKTIEGDSTEDTSGY
ncbi:hypothetical protein Q7P37_007191 [Cladosporium fusiforme]